MAVFSASERRLAPPIGKLGTGVQFGIKSKYFVFFQNVIGVRKQHIRPDCRELHRREFKMFDCMKPTTSNAKEPEQMVGNNASIVHNLSELLEKIETTGSSFVRFGSVEHAAIKAACEIMRAQICRM